MSILFALLAGCATAPTSAPAVAPPNVLFISVDTTRVDDIGFFGGDARTPHLDALLDDALVLADHRSCSGWTYTSMTCLFTGAAPVDLGFLTRLDQIYAVPDDTPLVAERLADLGWRTGLISTNPYIGRDTGLARGFSYTDESTGAPADAVTDAALERIATWDDRGDAPWYVHAHYIDPHDPYDPPADYYDVSDLDPIDYDLDVSNQYDRINNDWPAMDADTQSLVLEHMRRRYLGELAFFDAEVGRLLDTLEREGRLSDTAVVVLSDHGEQLFEHGEWGHSASLHRGENRALAAIRWPDVAPGWWGETTTHQDIWPTLFAGLGLDPISSATGVPAGQAAPDRPLPILRVSESEVQTGLIRGDDKLLFTYDADGASSLQRYDLAQDPGELKDLACTDLITQELRDLLQPTLDALTDLGVFAPPL